MSINKVILIGHVGGTPNVRTAGDNKVANFALATTEKFKDREETEWHNVAVWGKLADVIEKYVDKGSQLYVEGRIKTEKYTKDGQDKYITRIVASAIQLLGKKETQTEQPAQTQPRTTSPLPPAGEPNDNDLPFS